MFKHVIRVNETITKIVVEQPIITLVTIALAVGSSFKLLIFRSDVLMALTVMEKGQSISRVIVLVKGHEGIVT